MITAPNNTATSVPVPLRLICCDFQRFLVGRLVNQNARTTAARQPRYVLLPHTVGQQWLRFTIEFTDNPAAENLSAGIVFSESSTQYDLTLHCVAEWGDGGGDPDPGDCEPDTFIQRITFGDMIVSAQLGFPLPGVYGCTDSDFTITTTDAATEAASYLAYLEVEFFPAFPPGTVTGEVTGTTLTITYNLFAYAQVLGIPEEQARDELCNAQFFICGEGWDSPPGNNTPVGAPFLIYPDPHPDGFGLTRCCEPGPQPCDPNIGTFSFTFDSVIVGAAVGPPSNTVDACNPPGFFVVSNDPATVASQYAAWVSNLYPPGTVAVTASGGTVNFVFDLAALAALSGLTIEQLKAEFCIEQQICGAGWPNPGDPPQPLGAPWVTYNPQGPSGFGITECCTPGPAPLPPLDERAYQDTLYVR